LTIGLGSRPSRFYTDRPTFASIGAVLCFHFVQAYAGYAKNKIKPKIEPEGTPMYHMR